MDITLIGGGIMSATLGVLLRIVRPDATIVLIERLDEGGLESSDPWNNAGTGHAALCELHYTPQLANGTVDIGKALFINEQFELSLQFYAWIVEQGIVAAPSSFINPVPHVGIARGRTDVEFLRRRHNALAREPQFAETEYTEDPATISEWLPLMMTDRERAGSMAVTRHEAGTDVDFGALTRILIGDLRQRGVQVIMGHEVIDLERGPNDSWSVGIRERDSGQQLRLESGFVFVGAGGAAIPLLQKSGIAEIRGFGGFPVGGQFLRSTNPDLIAQHDAKVYARPAAGAPPMTAPHLDTRVIDGRRGLMFGPFAGFSTRFLKFGSLTDFPRSIRLNNLGTMLAVARDELPLTAYLIRQIMQSKADRIAELRHFIPTADVDDWELIEAGQRVQVMRPIPGKRGVVQFGTQLVVAGDGSIAGLLGASPGASTATAIMLELMERCFPNEYSGWRRRLGEAIPSLGVTLANEPGLVQELSARSNRVLGLTR